MGERQKILIMDDRPDPLFAAQRRLERAGHEVVSVQSYWSSVSTLLDHHLRGERFDAAFIDLDAGEPDERDERRYLPPHVQQLLEGFEPGKGNFSGTQVMPALHYALRNERDSYGQQKQIDLKMIWWTGHSGNKEYERAAVHQGVVDYVDKTENPVEIITRNTQEYPHGERGHVYLFPGLTGIGKTELERMIELVLGKDSIQMYRRIGNRGERKELIQDTIPMRFKVTEEMKRLGRQRESVMWKSYGKDYFIPITEQGASGMLVEIAKQLDVKDLGTEMNKVAANTPVHPGFHSLEFLINEGIDVMVAFGNAMAARECMLALKRKEIPYTTYLLELRNKREHMLRLLMKYDVPPHIITELPIDAPIFFEHGPGAYKRKKQVLEDIGFYGSFRNEQEQKVIERRLMNLGKMQYDFDWMKRFADQSYDTEHFYELKKSIVENLVTARMERAA